MGFHGFRSGGGSFGSVAPVVQPLGTASFSSTSTLVALAASVALIASDSSIEGIAAAKASFSSSSNLVAVAASRASFSSSSTLAAVPTTASAAFSSSSTLTALSASLAPISSTSTLGPVLTRKATFTATSALVAHPASFATIASDSTLSAVAISFGSLSSTSELDGLAASVAPLAGTSTFAVLPAAVGTLYGHSALTAIRASVATFVGSSSFAAVPYIPTTSTSLAVAWTASTDRFNPSRYTNYPYNSMAEVDGYLVGLSSDGAHILSGDDDNGTNIDASITTDFSDAIDGKDGLVSSPQLRSPNSFYVAYSQGPLTATLTVSNSRGVTRASYDYPIPEGGTEPATWRTPLGRGLRYRYSQLTLANVDGSDFALQDPEMLIDLLRRKI